MASPIQIGFLSEFSNLFLVVLMFLLAYAVLLKTKILGDNGFVNAVAALMFAFLISASPGAREMIKLVTPGFTFFIFVLITIVVLFMFIGVKEEGIVNAFKDPALYWFIIVVFILFILYAATVVYGEQVRGLTTKGEVQDSVVASAGKIVFHPKVLTSLLILSILAFAIRYLVAETS